LLQQFFPQPSAVVLGGLTLLWNWGSKGGIVRALFLCGAETNWSQRQSRESPSNSETGLPERRPIGALARSQEISAERRVIGGRARTRTGRLRGSGSFERLVLDCWRLYGITGTQSRTKMEREPNRGILFGLPASSVFSFCSEFAAGFVLSSIQQMPLK
jgi:hypothetical protein